MGPIIRSRNGYIDKFMGDGVMALFPNSVTDAVLAAVEMREGTLSQRSAETVLAHH